jgi:signal transduction histidine kinase
VKKDLRKIGENLAEINGTDTNAQLKTDTFDSDISSLIHSINEMLLNNRQGYLEVLRMEIALKRAITNISHDLRTPLTSAKGYLQMAESGELDKETQARYFSIIRGRLDALTVLMDNLFAFSRAVEGDLTLSRQNIGNILRDTLVDNFAEIESKGFSVETDIPDTPMYCNRDENALKRVVQNLITNAVVHGREYLRVKLHGGTIEIANKADNLRDIDVNNIFERFYTADASRTGKRTGLGLAIAKELTEKMGGGISAKIDGDMLIIRVKLLF